MVISRPHLAITALAVSSACGGVTARDDARRTADDAGPSPNGAEAGTDDSRLVCPPPQLSDASLGGVEGWINADIYSSIGRVMKLDRSGGPPKVLLDGLKFPVGEALTADADTLYWVENTSIMRMRK